MKKIVTSILLALMLIAALPPLLLKPASAGEQENAMWLEPEILSFNTTTTNVGYRFIVYVWLWVTSQNMYTWEFKLYYDATQLKVTNCAYEPGPTSEWATYRTGGATSPVTPVIEENYVLFAESIVGDYYVPAGTKAKLAKVEFEIIAAPPMGGQLTSLLSIDNVDTYVLNPDLDEIPLTAKEGATYTYKWVAPPKPQLIVDPAYREFGPYPPSAVGTEFDENIIIKGLSAAWFLKNASTWLAYNPALLAVVGVTFGPAWTYTEFDNSTAGNLYLFANATTPPSGDVLLATVRFRIIFQDTAPPRTPGEYDESPLNLHDYHLYAEPMEIPTLPEVDGKVRIYCLITLPLAYLEVSSHSLGPIPNPIGQEFNVTVSLKDLDSHWYLIGIQFRLSYPADLIEPVAVYEGPFLPGFAAQQPGSLGTFFVSYFESDGFYGPHVLVGEIIFPDENGTWHAPWPEGSGVIAIIKFKVKDIGEGVNVCGDLNIIEQLAIGLDGPVTQNIVTVPLTDPVNGKVCLTTVAYGRRIDLYGGAINEGYGAEVFPPPYGGQGPDRPMDLVKPQSQVYFYALVTYNGWPVQSKLVSFEVKMPDGTVYTKLTAITNSSGIATITFRMPWPCENPESLFGVWTVTATCSLADVVIKDTLRFHYDYVVRIWKVTTDKISYNHLETVYVTIEYGSHAMQSYPVMFTAVIQDELGVIAGKIDIKLTEVGGAKFCSYKNGTITLAIQIPKWAYAGVATVRVNAFDKEPADGGFAWCPEATTEIYIQPYSK